MTAFNVPAQNGRVVFITGANTGIGLVTARELARAGAQVFVACRTEARARETQAAIAAATGREVTPIALDLSDLSSVRRGAQQFLERGLPLHLLINNAGVAGQRGVTRDGFELTFGTNHLGHFLLTDLLLPRLRASAPARIVTVASKAHQDADTIPFAALRAKTASLTGMPEYRVSKLANVLFSAELARRLAGSGVTSYALHPGVVATDVWRHVPVFARGFIKLWMITPEQGALTTLYCATSPEVAQESGLYYDEQRKKEPNAAAQDRELARELWQRSAEWTATT